MTKIIPKSHTKKYKKIQKNRKKTLVYMAENQIIISISEEKQQYSKKIKAKTSKKGKCEYYYIKNEY